MWGMHHKKKDKFKTFVNGYLDQYVFKVFKFKIRCM